MTLLEWLRHHFGEVNLIIVGGACYTAWLHYLERQEHEQTQEHVRDITKKFIDIQLLQIQALNELSTIVRSALAASKE